eukprot:gene3586-7130_t
MALKYRPLKLLFLFVVFNFLNLNVCCGWLLLPPKLRLNKYHHRIQAITSVTDSTCVVHASTQNSTSSLASCAALVAGTTIGGGFIALPYVTMPVGAAPSVLSLILCWTYLLCSAFSLAQATLGVIKYDTTHNNTQVLTPNDDSDHDKISVFRIARFCFGPYAGVTAGILFAVLMLSTLVAQLSKAGSLGAQIISLSKIIPCTLNKLGLSPESMATVIYALIMSTLTFRHGQTFAEKMNAALTALMMFSFGAMVSIAPSSGWSVAGLKRANFACLLPAIFGRRNQLQQPHSWSIPVFLQLLVYSEVIPLICTRLKDEKQVRKAIVMGSSVPLVMCVVWTLTAIGLIPYNIRADLITATAAAGAIATASTTTTIPIDPVDILMAGSLSSITNSPISAFANFLISKAVSVLAFSAISTTVIGSCLTISQFVEDILSTTYERTTYSQNTNYIENGSSNNQQIQQKKNSYWIELMVKNKTWVGRILSILPAAVVAGFGSRSLYFAATAFAGSFPVTLLWGLFPPLACLRLAKKHDIKLSAKNKFMQITLLCYNQPSLLKTWGLSLTTFGEFPLSQFGASS